MSISYQKIDPFPFYSLNQFTQLQPLHSRVYLYQHNLSQQIFVVKEVPYSQDAVKIYQIVLKKQSMEGIVRLRGICLMLVRYGQRQNAYSNNINKIHYSSNNELAEECKSQVKMFDVKNMRDKSKKHPKLHQFKQQYSLLLFMQKCQCNMVQLVRLRRQQKKPFYSEEILNFISNTLLLLYTLQKNGVSHRDIKPDNFVYDHGRYRLCDFDDAVYFDYFLEGQKVNCQLDLTTLQYSSPQFYKNFKTNKQKLFDPYKLDVYSLGLTILYMCSLGKFDLNQRKQYLLSGSTYHAQFMKQQRRKILKNNCNYKAFNTIVKIMLEEDEYKRDNFVTLLLKIEPILSVRGSISEAVSIDGTSDNSHSQQNRNRTNAGNKPKNKSRRNQWPGTSEIQRKSLYSLLIFGFSFFILILIV